MKSALILVLFPLFTIGVFGDAVSVKEGDSVTLSSDLTKMQINDVIDWKLNGSLIFRINSDSKGIHILDDTDGKVGDRMQLDNQTGILKITNVRNTDSGEYILKIRSNTRPSSETKFSVNVVISGVKSVSVKEGDSVTLRSGVNKQRDDVIQWRHQNLLVAEYNIIPTYDPNKSFKLDNQTGSLTITNITTEHAGDYQVEISSRRYTIHRSFSVNVSDELESVSVTERDSATLSSGLTEIQRDGVIRWSFRKTIIAEIIKADEEFSTYDDVLDGRFRDRLKLDKKTGSLTITNTRNTDSGEYEVKISSSRFIVHKRISVTVNDELESVSVTERDSATLNSGLTEIQRDGVIRWSFRKTIIAEIIKADEQFYTDDDVLDGRFRDRLKLDHQTGSLTITNTRNKDSGEYEVEISSSRFIVHKRIRVTINELESVSVTERDSATLNSGLTEIQRDVVIRWSFRKTIIAEIIKADEQFFIHDGPDGRFRGRLELDHQTGSLNITNTRITDSGDYEVEISSSRFIVHKRIRITVNELESVSVTERDSATLNSGLTEIQRDDVIRWSFRKTIIAEIIKADQRFSTYDFVLDGRFRDRLKLDNQTGSLTITNIRTEDSGEYKVEISSSRFIVHKRISVTVNDSGLSPGAVAGIVVAVAVLLVFAAGVIYRYCRCSTPERHREVNGQNHTSNEEEETKLTKPAEAVE